MDVGKNIKQLRELKNFTQAYMADHLNMSIGGYSKIETGQTDVSLSKIQQIAEILETDLNTILNFDPKNVFNQCNNTNSVVTGIIDTQNNNGNIVEFLSSMQDQIKTMQDFLYNDRK